MESRTTMTSKPLLKALNLPDGEVAKTKHGRRHNIGSSCNTSCQHINTKKSVSKWNQNFSLPCTYSTDPKINEIASSVAPKQLILRSHTHWLSPMDETANQGLEVFLKKSLLSSKGLVLIMNLSIQYLL